MDALMVLLASHGLFCVVYCIAGGYWHRRERRRIERLWWQRWQEREQREAAAYQRRINGCE